ncbi:RagB/SusD family nutrient uptake outer membrane protein [Mucilaginibacter sp. BJC16-A38]|uniref:RagB/SusD family nutrient uptake outer membrane protein n=1 Tax=Mucilaginibacter phenanthrenivorans TaxID=1234842 RepID=UPI002157662B|nr:RagB/SusD family nutrient uptake outer membrane protein [Mucilaginibacter phenanthrenivorans]MCR8558912.1 RagB/SusD family nutrient uptake outer membrane protein [Mucilaginibacter phenanthrenivorans]
MKKYKYLILLVFLLAGVSACRKLNIPPKNIIQDADVFSSNGGIQAYMARLYSELPIEDFRYSPQRGLNFFWIISPTPATTGEALSRDQTGSMQENLGGWNWDLWSGSYTVIHDCDYFIQTLPKYASTFSTAQVNAWLGEAYFVRGMTYFALVKRLGGVPIVNTVLNYTPGSDVTDLKVPRSSEQAVWDQVASDFDFAIANLPAVNTDYGDGSRANKYVAAAFKSRAMLYAGTIAKYNTITLFDANKNQLCGIPASAAASYFQKAYDAAKTLDGIYSLYLSAWSPTDKAAQYQNFVNMFFDAGSKENIFVREYSYPNSVHGYDAYNVPRQLIGPNGYSAEVNPTLNFVEMFGGLPKNADGTLKTLDASGHYNLYTNTMDLFANAEPRLRATVIFPGDVFKGQNIEIRRGIYTGAATGGISPLLPAGSRSQYPLTNLQVSSTSTQTAYKLPDGTLMNPAGLSGIFTGDQTCAISGFSVRKWLDPNLATSQVKENNEAQTWIEMRYAEVLLNRAEAALELGSAGTNGANAADAFTVINQIRSRAGATQLSGVGALTIDTLRMERRKELAFENKTYWDLRRWRIFDKEQNGTIYKILMPFYSSQAGKYFFDARTDERNDTYTYDPRWYYEQIPQGAITKSTNLIQNPGY